MSSFHCEYHAARAAAQRLADQLGREVGLEKFKEFDKPGFRVFSLPRADHRYGFELRCELVAPSRCHRST